MTHSEAVVRFPGYTAAVILLSLCASGCSRAGSSESGGAATAEQTAIVTQALSGSEASATYAAKSERPVRVVPITAQAAASSDARPWYTRTMQPPPQRNADVVARGRGTPEPRTVDRPRKKAKSAPPRNVAQQRPRDGEPSRDPYSAYASAPRPAPEPRRNFFLFGW
jgi:hypothetical protein